MMILKNLFIGRGSPFSGAKRIALTGIVKVFGKNTTRRVEIFPRNPTGLDLDNSVKVRAISLPIEKGLSPLIHTKFIN